MNFEQLLEIVHELSVDELLRLQEAITNKLKYELQPSSTKIGVFRDIHGDLEGFQRALSIFEREGVTQILCTGDVSDRGSDADKIVQLMQQHSIISIAGNHDRTIVEYQDKHRETDNPERLKELGRIVSDETVEFLIALPESKAVTIDDWRILIAHGTPWSDVMSLFPDSRQAIYDRVYRENHEHADVIILGHSHKPMWIKMNDLWIINPGSVYGVTARDSYTCGVLELPSFNFAVYNLEDGQPIDLSLIER